MTPAVFTAIFAAILLAGLLMKLWLASRQIRHVALHRSQVPGAFAQRIRLEAHQKAADYTITKTRFGMVEITASAMALIGWTLLGGLDWLNQTLLLWLGTGLWQQLALLGAVAVISSLVDLPVSLYQTFVIEEKFGFNKMTYKLWLADLIKSALIGALIGLPIAALILWLMGVAGGLWWLWAWCVWAGLNLLMLVMYPTYIAPLFNKFEPLTDEAIQARVTALMARCGFSAKGLFVMDGSKRSAHANAYFTGFGAAKRVVFFDTLLRQLSPAEVDAVLAHELGHFKHKHIIQRIVSMFAISLAGFALLGFLSEQIWFYLGLGVRPLIDGVTSASGTGFVAANAALALLLFTMIAPVFTVILSPVFAQLSRKHEFEADAYAVAQTNSTDLQNALLKLYEDNASTLTPDPVYVKFYYSHPPASERLARMHTALAPVARG